MITDKLQRLFSFLAEKIPLLKNKYFLSIFGFSIWMFGFDDNCIIEDMKYKSEITDLQNKIEMYKADISESIRKNAELKSSNDNLEKFAREQYKMKKKGEDIYIIQ